ncbi:unnamed protein product [Thelazia callipaeda]|uniref:Rubicon Homology domain-containing protein n=1 Tax=Thelazia callipaeda TaxID=103827 RepID=A0A158RCA5_THECL|nr:unnamed protein product [Thelazia callipaeda]
MLLQINYSVRSKRRNFSIEVGACTFYIDPLEMSRKSEYFELLTTSKHFVEGISGKGCLHDERDDIKHMLQSTCPTVYGICPRMVRVQKIPSLARLADKYDIKTLQISCELSAHRTDLRKHCNSLLVKLLQTAMTYKYDKKLQESLMTELLNRAYFSNNYTTDKINNKMTKEIFAIILNCNTKHRGRAISEGLCHKCGKQKTAVISNTNGDNLWKCDWCETVFCLECKYMPCLEHVKELFQVAFEKFEMEERIENAKKYMTQQFSNIHTTY